MLLPIDTRELMLHNGRIVRFRPLRSTDRAIYARAVMDLSPRSRYLRFFAPIPRLGARLLDQMTHIDGHRHVAYVALTPNEVTAVGVVRYIRDACDPQTGEIAIAVADEWQGGGLGGQLLIQTVEHARLAGLESLTATTLGGNRAALGLLQMLGFSAEGAGGPYSEHRLQLGR
jgi:acetyltransferase